MSEPEDVLSREVTIGAELDETGLSLKAKSRAVAGFDRLIGSLADFPAAYIETATAKKRLRASIDERLLLAQADIAEKKLRGHSTAGDDLLFDVMKREARRQSNAGAVAIEALNELKALPAPDQPSASAADEEPDGLDDDWLNQFSRFAEDASSEDLQQLWGRVLAGEICKPGSFSRSTLRFIAELDKETAENCQFAADRAVADFIPATKEWDEPEAYTIGLDLQRQGIIEGVGGRGSMIGFRLWEGRSLIKNRSKTLLVLGDQGAEVEPQVIAVTRLGCEVLSLLSPKDDTVALRALAGLIARPPVKGIVLGNLNGTHFEAQEVLWEAEKS